MPRFFVPSEDITNTSITVRGNDAHHISRALRMAVGDRITLCDSRGCEYDCVLKTFAEGQVVADIVSVRQQDTEPPYRLVLYQALPKGDKLDTVIQKSVECGVSRIVPFESERCVVRVKPEAEEKKRERRQRIALEAAKQCGRGVLPEVTATLGFEAMLQDAANADLVLFCYEGSTVSPLPAILEMAGPMLDPARGEKRRPEIAIFGGSEGGLSPEEAASAREAGFAMTGLGKRILRCETAPLCALSAVMYASGEF